MIKYLTYALILLFQAIQLKSQSTTLKPSDYQEVWHKDIPISGGLKVGTMYKVSPSTKVQKSFFINLPSGKYSQKLCVKINSRDGRFYASMFYDLKGSAGGIVELQWQSKHWDALQLYTTDKLAILATIGNSCNSAEEVIVPASWNKNDIGDTITIAINSDKFPKIEIFDKKTKKSKEYPCEIISSNDKVAYKCLCEIPINEIPKLYEMNVFHKVRSGASTSYKSFPILLKL
jgi:hypothetical protein